MNYCLTKFKQDTTRDVQSIHTHRREQFNIGGKMKKLKTKQQGSADTPRGVCVKCYTRTPRISRRQRKLIQSRSTRSDNNDDTRLSLQPRHGAFQSMQNKRGKKMLIKRNHEYGDCSVNPINETTCHDIRKKRRKRVADRRCRIMPWPFSVLGLDL